MRKILEFFKSLFKKLFFRKTIKNNKIVETEVSSSESTSHMFDNSINNSDIKKEVPIKQTPIKVRKKIVIVKNIPKSTLDTKISYKKMYDFVLFVDRFISDDLEAVVMSKNIISKLPQQCRDFDFSKFARNILILHDQHRAAFMGLLNYLGERTSETYVDFNIFFKNIEFDIKYIYNIKENLVI